MIIGMSCIAVYAAEDAGNYGDYGGGNDNNAGEGHGDAGNAGNAGNAGDGQGDAGASGEAQGDAGNSGYNDSGSGYDYGSGDSGYDPYANPGYVDNGSQDDQGSYNTGSGNSGQDTAGSVTDRTTLYDTDDVDNKDLEANQWSDIEIDDSKAAASGTTDFTQMQTDEKTEDDSQWMLYVGIALVGLSFLGILYFILASVQAKKRNNRRLAAERQRTENPHRSAPSRPAQSAPKAAKGHYADDNYAPRRKSSPRSDTDEIYLPKRVK